MAKRKENREDILQDYFLLESMTRELHRHKQNLKRICSRIERGMDSYNKYGLIDVLSMVSMHIERADRELEKARKELKLV
jgi:hypothetical protein